MVKAVTTVNAMTDVSFKILVLIVLFLFLVPLITADGTESAATKTRRRLPLR